MVNCDDWVGCLPFLNLMVFKGPPGFLSHDLKIAFPYKMRGFWSLRNKIKDRNVDAGVKDELWVKRFYSQVVSSMLSWGYI